MNSLDWFQNGILIMLLSRAAWQENSRAHAAVSGMLFAIGGAHLVIAIIELIKGNTP